MLTQRLRNRIISRGRGIYFPSPLVCHEKGDLRREPARAAEFIDPTYAEKYDDRTVFYDAVAVKDEIILVGPPLLNLESAVLAGEYKVDGQTVDLSESRCLERSQITRLNAPGVDKDRVELSIRIPGLRPYTARLNSPRHRPLAGRRVLMTLQKNEELDWIRDWVTYYARTHGVDAVLVYDNGSDRYSLGELHDALGDALGSPDNVIVVDWAFKYGPQGRPWVGENVPWDSDFCQIGAFQDARYRWLTHCEGVINADIDELVISKSGKSVFDVLARSKDGVVGYKGLWADSLARGLGRDELPRYWHLLRMSSASCGSKWTASPGRWPADAHPTAHFVRNVSPLRSNGLTIAHFRALNSGWKSPKRRELRDDADGAAPVDLHLVRALAEAYRDRPSVIDVLLDSLRRESGLTINAASELEELFAHWICRVLESDADLGGMWLRSRMREGSTLFLDYETSDGVVALDVQIAGGAMSLRPRHRTLGSLSHSWSAWQLSQCASSSRCHPAMVCG